MLTRLPNGTSPKDIASTLRAEGAVIIEDLLDSDCLQALNRDLDPFLTAPPSDRSFLNPGLAAFFGDKTRHLTSVTAHSATFAEKVLCHQTLLGICDDILLPSCARYQMNLAHVLDRGPGADAQMLHRDELVWVHMPKPHPELQIASMIALVNFDEDNGATRVVPQSHRWAKDRVASESEIAHATMRAGSAIVYLGSTIHGGGRNASQDRWRRGVHLSYVLGWLRTEENNYLGTPPEIARTLSRRAQELIGYAAHDAIEQAGGYLGAVDLRDPVDLIEQGRL